MPAFSCSLCWKCMLTLGYYIVLAPAYYAGACFFFLCRCWSYFVMQILVYDFCSDACLFSWCQSLLVVLVLMFACFLVLILFFLLLVLLILACHSCSDACLVVWCMCLLVFLVLKLSCFSCLMFACFSCMMLAFLAWCLLAFLVLFLWCSLYFLCRWLLSCLFLLCRFSFKVCACLFSLSDAGACFPFADARLLVLHILACISCVDSCLVF